MVEDWVAWPVLGVAVFVYCLMTLTLRAIEPQSLTARLGLPGADSKDQEEGFSPAEYRATRIVVTTVRTATVIAVVMSALEGASSVIASEGVWLMTPVAVAVLVGVILLRTLLNRLADSCYEDVRIWLSPIIWMAALAGRMLRLNKVAEYIYESENGAEGHDEAEESVLNVLQNISSNDLRAGDLMIPLSEVVAVDQDMPLDEIAKMMVDFDLDSILIYGGKVDDVLGAVSKTNALHSLTGGKGSNTATETSMLSEVFVTPVSQQVSSLFDDFKDRPDQTAVMLDEEGLVAGILTYDQMLRRLFINGSVDEATTEGRSSNRSE